ncbi:NACHT domain-containing protein [Candidatus Amarolinea dominans]|uniref:NACHT domain-containing protein n=1 Tax=Candidatus Amarolinea dominans TaxID=3140696 RepID=UPI001D1CD162|nr:NACHT domain-containing protein [Anaerolineae bacterium]
MNLQAWQAATRQNLGTLSGRLRRLAPGTLYGFLAATTLLPVVTAANQGDFAALVALGSVIGGIGGDLVANQIQAWKDRSEAELAAELQQAAAADPAWRQELDTVLEKLDAIQTVQAALGPADRTWFGETIRQELTSLGNLDRFQATLVASSGAIVQGENNIGAGAGGVAAREIHAPITIINQTGPAQVAPDPANLRLAYLNHLYEQANILSLAGIDPKAASDAEARLNLASVYTALLTRTQEDDALRSQARKPDERPKPLSALAQLNRYDRLVLLGDPGSGKSTFVSFVALCLAGEALHKTQANLALLIAPLPDDEEEARRPESEEKKPSPQPWKHGALLPVRVVLRDFAARGLPKPGRQATATHLWEFIVAELNDCALPDFAPRLRQEWMDKGGLLLLDGLDEVPEANQRRTLIKAAVEDFASTFPRCRILVTSRTYAYQQQDWQLNGFQATVLAPFSPGQVGRFVERWYAHIGELRHWNAGDAQGRAEVLKRAIAGSDRLRALAERPLLLTLMASLHAWRGGSLPEKREELYADAVDLLLDWWESQRVVRNPQGQVVVIQPSLVEWLRIDRQKMRAFLNELAFQAHATQAALVGTADIAEKDLVAGLLTLADNEVKPKLLLTHLSQRAGLLLPRGGGVYTFPHRHVPGVPGSLLSHRSRLPRTGGRPGARRRQPLARGGPLGRGQGRARDRRCDLVLGGCALLSCSGRPGLCRGGCVGRTPGGPGAAGDGQPGVGQRAQSAQAGARAEWPGARAAQQFAASPRTCRRRTFFGQTGGPPA